MSIYETVPEGDGSGSDPVDHLADIRAEDAFLRAFEEGHAGVPRLLAAVQEGHGLRARDGTIRVRRSDLAGLLVAYSHAGRVLGRMSALAQDAVQSTARARAQRDGILDSGAIA